MRTLLLLAPLALLPGAPGARQESASAAQQGTASARKLAALIERFNKADGESRAAYDRATTESEKAAIYARRPGKEFLLEFRTIAEEARGTETAVQAWLWVLKLLENDPREARRIVELLLAEHIQSPALGGLIDRVRGRDMLRKLVELSPHAGVRARALTALGQMLLESRADADRAEGRRCLEAVIAEYGEVASGDSTYGKTAERSLFELDHLHIGMIAPDFEAADQNGTKWKLSDYRGKVVVLVFWGFWCSKCMDMLPHEKALVQRLADRPFALLGVNSDDAGAELKKNLAEQGITWRQAVDGDLTGPLATRWNVNVWPLTYVLDAQGVIRYRGVRGEAMERAVLELIEEATAGK